MINAKDDDFYLDLKYLDRLYPPHQSKGIRLDPLSGKSLSREEAAKIDHEALDELDELLASLDDELDELLASLDDDETTLDDDETTLDDELDELLASLDDDETTLDDDETTLDDDETTEDTKPDLAAASNNQLLQWVGEISVQAGRGHYDEETRQYFWDISLELTERNTHPIDRKCLKFDFVACKKDKTTSPVMSQFMRDLQVVDIHFVYQWHRGHLVNSEAFGGLLMGIFEGGSFKKPQAEKIAALNWAFKDTGNKKGKLGAGGLCLPEDIQEKLAVLRTDAVRQRQDYKKAKERDLINKKSELERRLREYIDNYPKSRMSADSVLVHCDVWLSMKRANNSVAGAIAEYEKLTGFKVGRDFIKSKSGLVSRLSKSLKWGI
jgi:hypothetical protein